MLIAQALPIHALLPEASSAHPTTPRSCPSKNSPAGPSQSGGEAACRHHGETDGLLALKYALLLPNPIFRSFAGLHDGLRDNPYPAPLPSAPHPRGAFFETRLLPLRRASPVKLHRLLSSLGEACRPTANRSAEEETSAAAAAAAAHANVPSALRAVPLPVSSSPSPPPTQPPAPPLFPSPSRSGENAATPAACFALAAGSEWHFSKTRLERVTVGPCLGAAGDAGPCRDGFPEEYIQRASWSGGGTVGFRHSSRVGSATFLCSVNRGSQGVELVGWGVRCSGFLLPASI